MHQHASNFLILSFSALVVFVVALMLGSVRLAAMTSNRDIAKEVTRAGTVIGAWIALSGVIALTGVFADFSLPPKLPIFLFLTWGLVIWLAFSPYGSFLAQGVPLWALVGIQGFRFPLELLMHHAFKEGVMPVQMSYSGQNYDIVTGGLALVVAVLAFKGKPPTRLVRIFNVVGFVLLLNVLVIAVLSMPLPLRQYMNEPANTWIGYFPFIWLPSLLVPLALLGHLLILKRLVSELSFSRA